MTADEISKQTELINDLARFLREDQIRVFVNDLKSSDGVPTDSQSLQEAMHRQGINMRYLGQIY